MTTGVVMKEKLTYELLALDPDEDAPAADAPGLLYSLRGYSALWRSPKVIENTFELRDGETVLHVSHIKPPTEIDSFGDREFGRAFIVTLTGEFDSIEPIREPLTGYLKDQKFDRLYLLKDEVSQSIACELYPYLYRIENQLRGYLIKFMSTRIGPAWWDMTVPQEARQKVNMRKKNETVFGKYIDNSAYLIDFDELGEIIYEQSSGFVTKADILNRIIALKETSDAIKELKTELQTNYQKLFRESFADKDFREKWKTFEVIRNKIAHSNLFTADDLSTGKRLAMEIETLIAEAENKTEEFVITEKELEAIKESFQESFSDWGKEITEAEFLRHLANRQAVYERTSGFVGISAFLRSLTNLGFAYFPAKAMLEKLESSGDLEIYSVPNPQGDHEVSAIKIVIES